MPNILIIGASGMLGSTVVDCLSRNSTFQITAAVRDPEFLAAAPSFIPEARWTHIDVVSADSQSLVRLLDGHEWVINAIGITKPLIDDRSWTDLEQAVKVNVGFPIELARAAETCGARVLQIATDCAFSGAQGPYDESSSQDPSDVYGKTKSLGEVPHPNVHHLRCSIIGPEARNGRFLVDWLLRQPRGAQVKGYLNHFWNGLTTLQFAQICEGIIVRRVCLPQLQHVVPGNPVSKAELLLLIAAACGRSDIQVNPIHVATTLDRTLATQNPTLNAELWAAAGHAQPPTIAAMVGAMAAWEYRCSPVAAHA